MDATRGLNRRWIARVSIVVALPLIGVLLVGAIEGAGVPSGSPPTIGPATPSAANSEPTYSTSLRIRRGPAEPPSDTSLRILDVISDPERLGQPGAVLGDFAGQASPSSPGADAGPITNENGASRSDWEQLAPTPPARLSFDKRPGPISGASGHPFQPGSRGRGGLEQPTAVRWAFDSQPTAPPPAADAAPMAAPWDAPWSDRERLVLTATEAPSMGQTRELGPATSQPLPDVPPESGLPSPQSERFPPQSGPFLPRSEPLPGIESPLLGQPTTLPPIADAAPMTEPTGVAPLDRYRLALAPMEGSSTEDREDGVAAASSEAEPPEKLGEEPEEPKTELQFLRRDSVLLEPGEYEIDVTCEYLIYEGDSAFAEIEDDVLRIGEASLGQRLLRVPLEFRLGVCQDTQAFVYVPFGWSNTDFAFLGRDEYANAGGIGDVHAGISRLLLERDEVFPDVVGMLAFSAPTGKSDLATSLATPGSSLGDGFWGLMIDLTFIHIYDPVALFYKFGYKHRFPNEFEGGFRVDPGKEAYYALGVGFAVNPRVTFSTAFTGRYTGDDRVNGVRVPTGVREPMYLRFAATIVRDKQNSGGRPRTVEPFVSIGMTDGAPDSWFGVSWTR